MAIPILPYAQTLVSSRGTHWNGLVLEEKSAPAAEVSVPPLDSHFLCFNLGPLNADRSAGPSPFLYQSVSGSRPRERHQAGGELVLLPADRASHWQWDQRAHLLHLLVPPHLLARAATENGGDGNTVEIIDQFGEDDPLLLHLALALREEARSSSANGSVFAESISNALTIHLLRRYSPTVRSRESQWKKDGKHGLTADQVRLIRAYVHDHLAGSLTLEEAARCVHVSPYHFARQFRAATGQSFHQFVIAERVEAAKRLLSRRGELAPSLAQIAVEVGFAHQSHLALHLRKMTGLSPLAFRQEAWR